MGITLDQDVSAVLYLHVYFHCFFFFTLPLQQCLMPMVTLSYNSDCYIYMITGTVVAILVLARLYKLLVSGQLSLTYTYHISHTKINNRGFFKFFRYNFLSIH